LLEITRNFQFNFLATINKQEEGKRGIGKPQEIKAKVKNERIKFVVWPSQRLFFFAWKLCENVASGS